MYEKTYKSNVLRQNQKTAIKRKKGFPWKRFFLIIFIWTVGWLGWNSFAPKELAFDPRPAFVLWLIISNMIQILLMPLIMIGQNIQGRHSELRAETDFHINKRSEKEIEVILMHLENQNKKIAHITELLEKK